LTGKFINGKIEFMLTKRDLKDVKQVVQEALKEFFETLILPYFEHNEKDHKDIKQQLNKHEELLGKHDLSLDKIYRKLEKSDDDHEEIFNKLEKIDRHVQGYQKRILKLENAANIL